MKPLTTYIATLAVTFAGVFAAFHAGQDAYGTATLIAGALALLSFQGRTQFYKPFWAEGIEIPPPDTSHIAIQAIITEFACFLLAGETATTTAIAIRAGAFLLQLAMIGKLTRDTTGDPAETIEAAKQDSTLTKTKP